MREAPHVRGATSMRARVWARLFGEAGSTPRAPDPAHLRVREDTSLPARLGRFEVLGHLGSGGMGAVYRARDPELGREVALKVVREQSSSPEELGEAQSRLRREAQAMARLRHPGVVTIHEVGVVEGRIYIAMECVDGIPLSRWVEQTPRSWRELVRVFIAAGEGLAAAHEAGVVHHDFKLDNVLVDRAGRVSVADFGLAHLGRQLERTRHDAPASEHALLETRPGAVMGTPAYMAPEQLMGGRGDPSSDQFSFCVALYRALFGQLPFHGEHPAVYSRSVLAGALRPPPRARGAPRRLYAILKRGLANEPSQRWPSMRSLVQALETTATPRGPRRALTALAALAVVGAIVTTSSLIASWEFERCVNADPFGSVWDDSVKEELAPTNATANPNEWLSVTQALEEHTRRWREHTRSLCSTERDWRRGFESRAASRCTERGLDELRAFVDALREGESSLAQASAAVADLRPPALVCLPGLETERVTSPEIRRARALLALGQVNAARELLLPVRARAEERGDAKAEAAAAYELGRVYAHSRDYDAAADSLARSVELAAPHQRVLARSYLAYVESARPDRAHVAREHIETARRELDALRDRGLGVLRARCANNLALALRRIGEIEPAIGLHMIALDEQRSALGVASPEYASSLLNIGISYRIHARQLEGDARRDALDRAKRQLTDADSSFAKLRYEHPKRYKAQQSLANVLTTLKKHKAAEQAYRAVLKSREELYGASDPRLINPLYNLGKSLARYGDANKAIDPLQRGIKIAASAPSPDSRDLVDLRFLLGYAYNETKQTQLACEQYQRALELEGAPGVTKKTIDDLRNQHEKHCSPPDDPATSESGTE